MEIVRAIYFLLSVPGRPPTLTRMRGYSAWFQAYRVNFGEYE